MLISTTRGAATRLALATTLVVTATAFGCSKDQATQPTPPPEASLTITITPTGASPRNIVVPRGSQVTFVNNDTVTHQMYSDPHPEHTDCPEFDSVGPLSRGQTRSTTNLVTARTCNFHDHLDFSNTTLRGAVVIQP